MEEPLLQELDRGIRGTGIRGRSEAIREAVREWLRKQILQKKIGKEIGGYRKKPVQQDEFDLSSQEWPS